MGTITAADVIVDLRNRCFPNYKIFKIMKTFFNVVLFSLFATLAISQTVNITVNYGYPSHCDVCGVSDYVCNNDYPGPWNDGIQNFTDPVPPGNVVTGIFATVYYVGCGAPFTEIHFNGVPQLSYANVDDCSCGGCYDVLTGLPGPYDYNYGGSNELKIVPMGGFICLDRVEVQINYEPACDISVWAGNNQTVYYGYAPAATATLNATVTGGDDPISITWYDDQFNVVGSGASINVSPSVSTGYAVEVVDANECYAVDYVTVCVVDVRCGNNGNKVQLCHNDGTICVSANAVASHLSHGDLLGACNEQPGPCEDIFTGGENIVTSNPKVVAEEFTPGVLSFGGVPGQPNAPSLLESGFSVQENPFVDGTTLRFRTADEQKLSVKIFDLHGRMVANLFDGMAPSFENLAFEFDASALPAGLYICQLQTNGYQEQKKLVKIGGRR